MKTEDADELETASREDALCVCSEDASDLPALEEAGTEENDCANDAAPDDADDERNDAVDEEEGCCFGGRLEEFVDAGGSSDETALEISCATDDDSADGLSEELESWFVGTVPAGLPFGLGAEF